MVKPIYQETLCCGYKRCPTVAKFEDGSLEIRDDDAENGSVGVIKLRPEQVARLIEISEKAAASEQRSG